LIYILLFGQMYMIFVL